MLELEVVTPYRQVLHTQVESVIVPATDGYLGIMSNHAPLVCGLAIGVLHYGPAHGAKQRLALSGGFLEVTDNKVTVLADTAELAEEIDVLRAQEAKRRAEHRLRTRAANIDYVRAELALKRAMARLQAVGVEEEDQRHPLHDRNAGH
ncbi:MAG: ATP synthase F1 subunit epsilon [Firmicutes bacterium ZCTH02-B6]|nr:MAG: ATP synthase F1 subunit epsilon [Firmicutes bacterium ZCTH02-B6]